MIQSLSLKNFKGFKDLPDLEIKPITILCGTNSSGKSSIMQSLLLIKQTLESKNPDQTILLNGRFVRLGIFKNIIYNHNLDEKVGFSLEFTFTKKDLEKLTQKRFPVEIYLMEIFYNPQSSNSTFSLKLDIELEASESSKNIYSNPVIVKKYCITASTILGKKVFATSHLEMEHINEDDYIIRWDDPRTRSKKTNSKEGKIAFVNMLPVMIAPTNDIKIPRLIRRSYFLNDLLQMFFSSIKYIGPLREEPLRRYIYEDEITEIGLKGENAPYIYLADRGKTLSDFCLYDKKKNAFIKNNSVNLVKAVNQWLNVMDIKGFTAKLKDGIIALNLESASSKEKVHINIADVGFGVSQIFPIVLEGLRMKKGNMLMLEQPEIHLHPNLQMQLADYFISLGLSGKNVMVETHSDHIINRIVRRIVEDTKYNLKDLVQIYFIRPTADGSQIEKIQIDDVTGLVTWPKDFFDQTAFEQEKILQAEIAKRKMRKTK